MKAKKITPILILSLVTTAFLTPEAFSQKPFKRHKPPRFNIEMLADELELTQEQLTKMKEQRFATQKNSIELRSKVQIAVLELRRLLEDETTDENKIKSKIEEIGKLKTELHWTRVQGRLNIKNLLTSEQLEKLQELKKERMKKRLHRERPFKNQRPFKDSHGNNGSSELEGFDFEQDELDNEWTNI